MSIFILITCLGLLFASGYLSFKNSSSIIEAYSPPPVEKTHIEATEKKNLENTETWNTYRADSVATFASYNAQKEATRNEYKSKIKIKDARINRFKRKSQREGLSYKSKILLLKQNIAELEAERNEKLSKLSIEETTELKALLDTKNSFLSKTKETHENEILSVNSFNDTEKKKSELKVERYGLGLGSFTLLCLIILVLSITLDEIHKKGSGIDDKVIVSQYHFSGSIVGEFIAAISQRINQRLRTKIANFENKTLAPPLPVIPSDLYDLSELQNDSVKIKVEEKGNDKTKVIYLQTKKRTYDNRRGQKTAKKEDKTTTTKGKERECEYCNNEYTYNHAKQKYCSDSCRIKAWEERNGKKLSKRKAK